MHLVRFGEKGSERPGKMDADGRIVDLREIFPDMPDIGPAFFAQGWMARAASVAGPGTVDGVRLGPPVCNSGKIVCLGKNYAEHAREGGFDAPAAPLLFAKAASALNGPRDDILLPASSGQVDWEVELAVVIGREGKGIEPARALDHVAGFTVMNDVSGREAQFGDGQWFRGKSFDTFAPLGPVLATLDEIEDLSNLTLTASVNGAIMQKGNTRDLIHDIPSVIAYISRDITLKPGDIISTGTPAGVGIFREPPVVLNAGDVVTCRIEPIGSLVNRVVGPA